MQSIFDLKTQSSQLAQTNQGVAKYDFVQQAPTRDITGASFPNGTIYIKWSMNGQKWWIPAKSYIRFRVTLTEGLNAVPLGIADNVAPAMGFASNLFQSLEFLMNGVVVSRVSNEVPQVDALKMRLSKSKAWLDSVGAETNFWQPSFQERLAVASKDGYDKFVNVRNSTLPVAIVDANLGSACTFLDPAHTVTFVAAGQTITFLQGAAAGLVPDLRNYFSVGEQIAFLNATEKLRPITAVTANVLTMSAGVADQGATAIGAGVIRKLAPMILGAPTRSRRLASFEIIWQPPLSIFSIDHALPVADYELRMNPQDTGSYIYRCIESLGVAKVAGALATNVALSINDMYLYTCEVDGPRVSDLTYMIDLEETRCSRQSANNLATLQQQEFNVSPSTMALTLAFQDAGTGSSSLFSASKFKIGGAEGEAELNLNRMYIQYASQTKPSPDAVPEWGRLSKDYFVQRYTETIMNSGMYHLDGGAETIRDWIERGAFYHFTWPRDGSDRSTRVQCNFQFSAAPGQTPFVLLFDHYRKVAKVRIEGGRVVDIVVEEA